MNPGHTVMALTRSAVSLATVGALEVDRSIQSPRAAVLAGKPNRDELPSGPRGPIVTAPTAFVLVASSFSIDTAFTGPKRPRSCT